MILSLAGWLAGWFYFLYGWVGKWWIFILVCCSKRGEVSVGGIGGFSILELILSSLYLLASLPIPNHQSINPPLLPHHTSIPIPIPSNLKT